MGAYAFQARDALRERWRLCLIVALSLTVIFIVYHKRVPGPMFDNIVLLMQAVPMALICICVVGLFHVVADTARIRGRHWNLATAGLVMVTIVSVMHLRPVQIQPGAANYIRELAFGIRLAAAKSGRGNQLHWPRSMANDCRCAV